MHYTWQKTRPQRDLRTAFWVKKAFVYSTLLVTLLGVALITSVILSHNNCSTSEGNLYNTGFYYLAYILIPLFAISLMACLCLAWFPIWTWCTVSFMYYPATELGEDLEDIDPYIYSRMGSTIRRDALVHEKNIIQIVSEAENKRLLP